MAIHIRRREFIFTLGGAAAAWPLGARAQQALRMRRVGVVAGSADTTEARSRVVALREALQKLGWTDDRNVRIDVRWAGSDPQRIQRETADLIARSRMSSCREHPSQSLRSCSLPP